MWRQFRHIGGVHETYLAALGQGRIVFDMAARTYRGGASKAALSEYFDALALRHDAAFEAVESDLHVNWFGEPVSVPVHLVRLIGHETLHHGQFILHWRALGRSFPDSWQAWGV